MNIEWMIGLSGLAVIGIIFFFAKKWWDKWYGWAILAASVGWFVLYFGWLM